MLLGDSWNYMRPILVPSSAKRIATQILVIAKLNEQFYFDRFGLWYHPSLQRTDCPKLATEAQE